MRVPLRARKCKPKLARIDTGKEVLARAAARADTERDAKRKKEERQTLRASMQDRTQADCDSHRRKRVKPRSKPLMNRSERAASRAQPARRPRCIVRNDARSDKTTSPASARASAKGHSWRASRTPPLRPAAQTDSAPLPSGKTSARTQCRCRASRRTPAARFPARHREWPCSSGLPVAMWR